jgi:hypothetical protein
MGDASIIECIRRPDNIIAQYASWNTARDNTRETVVSIIKIILTNIFMIFLPATKYRSNAVFKIY